MGTEKLALLGGKPVRTKEFRSRPCVDGKEIGLVTKLMKKGRFSKFIGSPVAGTRGLLRKKSKDLVFPGDKATFLGGEYVRRFEAEWSKRVGSAYCVSVNSATSGLTTALLAAGVTVGDEVITTPLSFTATATAILLTGAVPVFCDIDPETFCISPDAASSLIGPRTKAIMPVHWCGNAGDLNRIVSVARRRGIMVIEDSAQAPGTVYKGRYLGTYGKAGVFSFNEPKNVMTGEGGMVVTNDRHVAEKCRLIRNHGESIPDDSDSDDYVANSVGYNFRLTEIQSAIGYVQAKKLVRLNGIRSRNYRYLKNVLVREFGEQIIPQKITHPDSYFAYTAAFRWSSGASGIKRDAIAAALRAEGIPVVTGVARLMCDHPMFKRKLALGKRHFPWDKGVYKGNIDYRTVNAANARKLQDEYLGFFQMGWPNSCSDMDDIIKAFGKIMDNREALIRYSNTDAREIFNPGR